MKPTETQLTALVALLPLAAGLFQGHEPQDPAQAPKGTGALQRIAPAQEPEEQTPGQMLTRNFDRERWRELLNASDLERRERSFDLVVKRAGFDPNARAFLEELARDPQNGELAWTARLALRELGRARFPLTQPFAGFDPL